MGENSSEHKPFIRVKSESGIEHVHYSVLYEGFPEEFQTMANRELKETLEARKKGLQKLKEYMKNQDMPPLKNEVPLLAALRNCKYNLKKAEMKLDKLMSMREDAIARIRSLGLQTVDQILEDTVCGMLPYRDKLGRVIVYSRPIAGRLDLYTLADVALVVESLLYFQLLFPITSVSGYAYFGDCASPSLQLYYTIFKVFRSSMEIVLSLPIRMGRAEILNENSLVRCFLTVVKSIISKKIADRTSVHGTSFEEIRKMYHQDILPEEFGGNAGPLSSKVYKQKFLDFLKDLIDKQ